VRKSRAGLREKLCEEKRRKTREKKREKLCEKKREESREELCEERGRNRVRNGDVYLHANALDNVCRAMSVKARRHRRQKGTSSARRTTTHFAHEIAHDAPVIESVETLVRVRDALVSGERASCAWRLL